MKSTEKWFIEVYRGQKSRNQVFWRSKTSNPTFPDFS
jgi:type IV secretory pathway VirB3-like protein